MKKFKPLIYTILASLVVGLCLVLPSAVFHVFDTQVTEKRVEMVRNEEALNINNMSLAEKLTMFRDLEEQNVVEIQSGYQRTEKEAIDTAVTELALLFDPLNMIIDDYDSVLAYSCGQSQPMMIMDSHTGNTNIIWVLQFAVKTILDTESDIYMVLDDASGKILGLSFNIYGDKSYELWDMYLWSRYEQSISTDTESNLQGTYEQEAEDEVNEERNVLIYDEDGQPENLALIMADIYASYLGLSQPVIEGQRDNAQIYFDESGNAYSIQIEAYEGYVFLNVW